MFYFKLYIFFILNIFTLYIFNKYIFIYSYLFIITGYIFLNDFLHLFLHFIYIYSFYIFNYLICSIRHIYKIIPSINVIGFHNKLSALTQILTPITVLEFFLNCWNVLHVKIPITSTSNGKISEYEPDLNL